MKEALARFVLSKKQVKNRVYSSPRIYLPTKLVYDSSFPFKGDEVLVLVKIKGKKLVVQKATKRVLMKYNKLQEQEEG